MFDYDQIVKQNLKYKDEFRGCLIGGAAGDALGYPVEFRSAEEIFKTFVDEIVVCKDCFIWKLNFLPDSFKVDVKGRKNNFIVTQTACSSLPSRRHRQRLRMA